MLRVPLADGVAWFKACSLVQAFEPRLTAALFARWPDRVADVIAFDESRGWLLLADAGTPLRALGNPPQAWLDVLALYAELQRGEVEHAGDHIAHGVPELPVASLPTRYAELLERKLPIDTDEVARLVAFAPRFERLCAELAAAGLPQTVQHDDLHPGSVYELAGRFRLLDWGDCSISHPFFSLVVTFRSWKSTLAWSTMTPGSSSCGMHTSSPGVRSSSRRSSWRCASGASHMRSPGRATASS